MSTAIIDSQARIAAWPEGLPEVLRSAVDQAFQAFVDAGGKLPEDPELHAELAQVWATSRFVAESCARIPELLADLVGSGDLTRAYTKDELAHRAGVACAGAHDDEALGQALRRLRRREMVRIAWRDLAGSADLDETLADLSALAGACLDTALGRLHAWQVAQWGTPRTAAGKPQQLVVLGMGKLGARELNFSSDIDLIFAYSEYHDDPGCKVGCERFFQRLGQRLIQALDNATADGFVFRVDMRLRPYGRSGPLAMCFDALEEYYQTQGREWERYALIKARPVAGDLEAGVSLIELLRPFVYRRYVDFGVFESLREMKAMINSEVRRKGMEQNVKLGPGGIREVEFVGQAFQLVHGGREPTLRQRGILDVLAALAELGQLPEHAVTRLREAYVFLRRVENRLQAYDDRQTHDLPDDETDRLRLAVAMGCPDWETFAALLERHRTRVRGDFEQLFALPQAEALDKPAEHNLTAVWHGTLDDTVAETVLAGAGFDQPQAAFELLKQLRESRACRAQSAHGQKRLQRLMPLLLAAIGGTTAPTECLRRLWPLLETVSRRSAYIALLVENPMALSQLVRLVSASVWIALRLSQYPLLLDELLDPRILYRPPDRAGLEPELAARLASVDADDLELQMETLRHFKRANVLRVAAADVVEAIPLMVVSDHLTWIAETVLGAVHKIVWDGLVARHGVPECTVDGVRREAGFSTIAYGKLGGIELGYVSDLDIVFLHDSEGEQQVTNGAKPVDNAVFFARMAQRIIHILTTLTASGELYPVDTRLRPSGASGLMVSSLAAFAVYQRDEAWTWERQALVRARPVAGSAVVAERFQVVRAGILAAPRDLDTLRAEVVDMRRRMREKLAASEPGQFDLKQDAGGIADIEFMVQYGTLAWAHDHPALLAWTDNIRLLESLDHEGLLPSADVILLGDAYRAYRAAGHRCALQDAPALVTADEFTELSGKVTEVWRRLMEA
ncbi:MAG: bifunctional [glutamate--ammonia ligase]-adenylyl-L-tyrosine phosphorylase/[glutamate--ammonia-ligase] adenylyltransferase [Gammaproteobacteria bacterium]|nr:MAG: bifunctional [glutamate--ammonia ligase]-adenylyl-L-tyrosine phosphorylase/[glutamate--ammonia-ligase] adenylyltransferase [Gammaproteobacteria bacterium]